MALVGDNGAGKSTLVKIVAGVHQPNDGTVQIDGKQVSMTDPSDPGARNQVVYQDLALADNQPVYMNMFLGREQVTGLFRRLDRRKMVTETEALVKELDIRIPSAARPSKIFPAAKGKASRSQSDTLGLEAYSHG